MSEKKIAEFSEFDSRGHLSVACCECKKGGNGFATCASGSRSTTWDYRSCFSGKLLDNLKAEDN